MRSWIKLAARAALLLSLGVSQWAMAEVLVLVQGYRGVGDDWRGHGVAQALVANGWRDSGELFITPNGVQTRMVMASGPRKFYTLALPSEAPMEYQYGYLAQYLASVGKSNPGQPIILAGHSAGGILARLYMVRNPDAPIKALITIATPHLGTEVAELGLMAGHSPASWVAPLFGAQTINRSQGLYRDLQTEYPGGLLFWLNRQPHPQATYISVLRKDNGFLGIGNFIAPLWSQDMNNIPALAGRSRVIAGYGDHDMHPADGPLLVGLLNELAQQP